MSYKDSIVCAAPNILLVRSLIKSCRCWFFLKAYTHYIFREREYISKHKLPTTEGIGILQWKLNCIYFIIYTLKWKKNELYNFSTRETTNSSSLLLCVYIYILGSPNMLLDQYHEFVKNVLYLSSGSLTCSKDHIFFPCKKENIFLCYNCTYKYTYTPILH